ncbi:hypothetical protein NA56DRAFT_645881 [Hyaloscypha hepaticicola]|uniref:Uncharacterized protein n=1 Tax=Hyaloscypha hepaticicola TaxID=2082293 RepID=A0A2J6Q4K6_9HELO|nr:hypothetical protein NA56DRAFT_645881 [Hyaloscypha hepaticicola]
MFAQESVGASDEIGVQCPENPTSENWPQAILRHGTRNPRHLPKYNNKALSAPTPVG